MIVDQYFSEPNGHVCFTREQGSNFAKHMAGDFNPLHDADARRFCIPGDLLFSVVLAKYGVSQQMEFNFSGMVFEGVELVLPEPSEELKIQDTEKRDYLQVRRGGDLSRDETLLQSLTQKYVEFSGKSFPHILVPLLAEQNVMINAARPMVMYVSMAIDLDTLDIENPSLCSDYSKIEINGRRGSVELGFNFLERDRIIGRGKKCIILSGLREYDKAVMDAAIVDYNDIKEAFASR
jgi:hypothetical protein|tara:strand:+ start:66559 stop:67266 length:708 start_codon:yes stop_codon:yes gene_type:complete